MYLKRALPVLLMVFLMSVLVIVVASANGLDGTISGTLLVDGEPLEGVQVFLGINPPFTNPLFDPRRTCTVSGGYFEFEDVPFDTPLIMVTGPDAGAPSCDNAKFVDPTSKPEHPLMITVLLQFGTKINDNLSLDPVDVPRLPDEEPGLTAHARSALKFCHDKQKNKKAVKQVNIYLSQVDEKEAKGKLDGATAYLFRKYGEDLLFNFDISEICPAP